ncbi:alginate export family protein [Sphingomonas sp. MMS24-J45]|uniref:alginate export family protein n=1 Tax=Sphingomonas sp. MMS24-J45 TaxID=3238806 RepID=UPI00384AA8EE
MSRFEIPLPVRSPGAICNRHRWVPHLGVIGLLCMASIAPACAKDAKPGPLLKAVGAPAGLELRGSARSRVEAIDGQFRPNRATSDLFWSARTTLFAAYKRGPVRVGGELIDARGYGERANSSAGSGEIDALELSQAFVSIDLGDRLGHNTKAVLTGGRFTLDIGSSRLVGRADFPNTVNSYTGVNLDLTRPGKDRIFAFWAMPQTRLPADSAAIHNNAIQWDRESSALQLFGASYLRLQVRPGVSGEIYGYRLAEHDSPDAATRDRGLVTLGARLFRAPGTGFDYDAEAAYQFGTARATSAASDLADLRVSASFAHAELGRSFKGRWALRVSLHFDYASGDRGKPGEYGRFDPLFGMRRADLGPTGLYGPLGRSNIVSVGGESMSRRRPGGTVSFRCRSCGWTARPTVSPRPGCAIATLPRVGTPGYRSRGARGIGLFRSCSASISAQRIWAKRTSCAPHRMRRIPATRTISISTQR